MSMSPFNTRSTSPTSTLVRTSFANAVRLKNIGPNLTAKTDAELAVFNRLSFGFLLFPFQFVQSRAKHFHTNVLVLMLRPLVLALRDEPRGKMRDPHRRIGGVHVLSTLAEDR